MNFEPTRESNCLDLYFTSNSSLVKSTTTIHGLSDHSIVITDSYIKPQYQVFKRRTVLQFSKANWTKLKTRCQEISQDIEQQYNANTDTKTMWNNFKNALMASILECIPSKTITKRNDLPWINRKLKSMIRRKTRLHQKATKNKDWGKYTSFQKECKKAFSKAESDYINNCIEKGLSENNTKPFWRLVKGKKQDTVGVSPLLKDGKLATDSKSKAEILLGQFSSVFTKQMTGDMPVVKIHIRDSLDHLTIQKKGIEKLLMNINPSKAPGPDKIPNYVLKECASELSTAVTHLFQKSLDSGTLPDDWISANIAPIYKKGDRHLAENYRPVSLTCVLSKLLEHIVCRAMLVHFEKHNVLTNRNHGFRAGYSCETQLAVTIDDLMRNLDNKLQTDVVILDFSKAFDTVPHDRLLHKLESYGIRGRLLQWTENFLTKRKMQVVVDGETSTEADVVSGVPQGTVLGPILFLVLINDLPDRTRSTVRLFADDCLLYRTIKSIEDHLILQDDLKNLEIWAKEWGMLFNAKKCYVLSISKKSSHFYILNDTILSDVKSNPYLGLNISHDLKWSNHINSVCKKASSSLGFIRRNLKHCPKSTRHMAYISLVRSLLEYGAIIWDPYTQSDINRLERIQRQAARFISGDYQSRTPGSMSNMLNALNLPTLQQRRKEMRLTFLFKIAEGLVPAIPPDLYLTPMRQKRHIKPRVFTDCETTNIVNKYVTNNTRPFIIPQSSTNTYTHSFFIRTITEWNSLNNTTVTAGSVDSFKSNIKNVHIMY